MPATTASKAAKKTDATKPAKKAPAKAGPAKVAGAAADDLNPVFTELRAILAPLSKGLVVVHDTDDHYCVDTTKPAPNGKPMFFAAARMMKGKVSFYLMPVYTAPALLQGMSPDLKKRMQGKSCFNFSAVDKALFKELSALAKAGLAQFKKDGWA